MRTKTFGVSSFLAILFVVVIAAFDHSIINVALPVIGERLHITQSGLQWVAASYTIAFAAGLLLAGRLGDRFGRKRILLGGIFLFLLATIYTALSQSTTQLIAGRALMGVGGTLLLPSTLAIITSEAPEDKKSHMIGLWSAIFGMGIAVGPLLGGWLLNHYSWRSVFWVNAPLLVVAAGLVAKLVPELTSKLKPKLHLFDGLLSAVGIGGLIAALIQAPVWGFTNPLTLAYGLGSLLTLGLFLARQRRHADPLLDLSLFRNRAATMAMLTITLSMAAMAGVIFLLMQQIELIAHYAPLRAGLTLIPTAFGLIIGSILLGIIQQHHSTKVALGLGSFIVMIGLVTLALQLSVATSPLLISWIFGGTTIGLGIATAAATNTLTDSLSKDKAGITSALNDISRELGGSLGVAILGSIANWRYRQVVDTIFGSLMTPLRKLTEGGLAITSAAPRSSVSLTVLHQSQKAFSAGNRLAFFVAAGFLALLVILIHAFMPAVKPQNPGNRKWFAH